MQDAGLQHVCLDSQYEDSLRRQSPKCQNVWRREESGVVEVSRAHICQLIGGNIYQGYKNCVSYFKNYEKQRGNMYMYIGVWFEIGCLACKGCWFQSPVVTSGCRGWAQFSSWKQKVNLMYLLYFLYFIFFLSCSLVTPVAGLNLPPEKVSDSPSFSSNFLSSNSVLLCSFL